MTWNVQGRVGDWQARHPALRSWIERAAPDVLTLQESWVQPDGATQAARLGEELGMHAVTAADLAGFDRYPEAPHWMVNAVLSRWPLSIERLRPLPDERGDPTWRHVLVTRVHRPADQGGEFVAAGTRVWTFRLVPRVEAKIGEDLALGVGDFRRKGLRGAVDGDGCRAQRTQ